MTFAVYKTKKRLSFTHSVDSEGMCVGLKCTNIFAEINKKFFFIFFSLDNYALSEFVVGCFLKCVPDIYML